MYVYIYIYIYVCIYIFTHTHTYTHNYQAYTHHRTNQDLCLPTRQGFAIDANLAQFICICIWIYTYVYIYKYVYIYIYIYVYIHTHIYIYTYMYFAIYIYIHTHLLNIHTTHDVPRSISANKTRLRYQFSTQDICTIYAHVHTNQAYTLQTTY